MQLSFWLRTMKRLYLRFGWYVVGNCSVEDCCNISFALSRMPNNFFVTFLLLLTLPINVRTYAQLFSTFKPYLLVYHCDTYEPIPWRVYRSLILQSLVWMRRDRLFHHSTFMQVRPCNRFDIHMLQFIKLLPIYFMLSDKAVEHAERFVLSLFKSVPNSFAWFDVSAKTWF